VLELFLSENKNNSSGSDHLFRLLHLLALSSMMWNAYFRDDLLVQVHVELVSLLWDTLGSAVLLVLIQFRGDQTYSPDLAEKWIDLGLISSSGSPLISGALIVK
jgi:hypothetical protein